MRYRTEGAGSRLLIEDPPAVSVSVGKKALSRPDRTADPGRHIRLVCYCIFAG